MALRKIKLNRGEQGVPIQFLKSQKICALIFCLFVVFLFPLSAFAQDKPVGKIIGLRGFVEILVSEPVAEVKKGEAKKVAAES